MKKIEKVATIQSVRISRLFLLFLISIGFLYRIYGLAANYSFWSDETHTAIFVRAILERGRPVLLNGFSFGSYQWLQSWLSAVTSRFFGLNEFGIRFPSVIFGVLTIWATYLFGKKLFNRSTGLVAATLVTFLKIEILWSRQARPYQALQFFTLLSAYFVYRMVKNKRFNWRFFLSFFGVGILASLMHGLGLLIFLNGFLCFLLFCPFQAMKKAADPSKKRRLFLIAGLAFLAFLLLTYSLRETVGAVVSRIGEVNNFFYYRVFLWRNYSLMIFWAFLGFIFLVLKRKNTWWIPVIFLAIQGLVISFVLSQPFTRFFYAVFPFLVLLSAVGLTEASQLICRDRSRLKSLVLAALTMLTMVVMGNKFSLLPQRIYSLNEDMQEIPEVDWGKIYFFVGKKLAQTENVILVTNWTDLPLWYLGEGRPDYLLRKESLIRFDLFTDAEFILGSDRLGEVVLENKKGLIVIDSWDDQVPDGVRAYIKANFVKELEIDRLYLVQPRSWPVEVYSWGFEDD